MRRVWIIGAGKFGARAAALLNRHCPDLQLTLVDRRVNGKRSVDENNNRIVSGDGISFLSSNLGGKADPDWIVPAAPLHVAYAWIVRALEPYRPIIPIEIPHEIVESLPNSVTGADGSVYLSNADFMCPDDCLEPDGICTCTGQPRPRILHRFVSDIRYKDYRSIVIRSHQLAPGVGGYSPHALYAALSAVKELDAPVLLTTACNCHGVMNAFRSVIRTEPLDS